MPVDTHPYISTIGRETLPTLTVGPILTICQVILDSPEFLRTWKTDSDEEPKDNRCRSSFEQSG